jgi:hypothetical protein
MAYGHWKGKMKRRKSDDLFSKFIRTRDRKCVFGVRCLPRVIFKEDGELDIRYLDACHWKGRGRESVRCDPLNADAGCKKCHDWLDHTPEGQKYHNEFKLKQLGQKEYDLLEWRASGTGHRDEEASIAHCKELLKTIPEPLF